EHELSEVDRHSPSSSDLTDGMMPHDVDEDQMDQSMDDTLLDQSIDSIEDLKPGYQCRFCPTRFDERHQLNLHYTSCHRDKPQYTCDVCHTIFAVKRELSTHMRTHSGEQPHTAGCCPIALIPANKYICQYLVPQRIPTWLPFRGWALEPA
ncbi:zinc finger, C2H2 type, partial [Teladorsagia circumcincta]